MLKRTLLFTSLLAALVSPAQAELVAEWTFENGLQDSGPSGYDGIYSGGGNAPELVDAGNNHYMNFNTAGSIALPMYYDSNIDSLGLSMWFNTTYTSPFYDYQGFDSDTHVYDSAWMNYINSSFLDFDRSDYYSLMATGNGEIMFSYATRASGKWELYDIVTKTHDPINDGEWHKVNVNYNQSSGLEIYLDGSIVLSDIYRGAIGSDGGTTRYGYIGDGSEATTFDGGYNGIYYDGLLDNVAIYDDAMSYQDINDSYNSEKWTYADVPALFSPAALLFALIGARNTKRNKGL